MNYKGFIIHHEDLSKDLALNILEALNRSSGIFFFCSSDPKITVQDKQYRMDTLRKSRIVIVLLDSYIKSETTLLNDYNKEISESLLKKPINVHFFCDKKNLIDSRIFLKREFNIDRQIHKLDYSNSSQAANTILDYVNKVIDKKKIDRDNLTYYLNGNNIKDFYIHKWSHIINDDNAGQIKNNSTLSNVSKDYTLGYSGDDKRRECRKQLLVSEHWHICDMYEKSLEYFNDCKKTAFERQINFDSLTSDVQISEGHLLMHKNDIEGAIRNIISIEASSIELINKARCFFRLGECYVYQNKTQLAKDSFDKSLVLMNRIASKNSEDFQVLGDIYRKQGTLSRMIGDLSAAKYDYDESESYYQKAGDPRGKVWLKHGIAEYHKSLSYMYLRNKDQSGFNTEIQKSMQRYNQALLDSHEVFNINRVAHAKLGLLDINRVFNVTTINIDRTFVQVSKIYKSINSIWGIVISNILQELYNYSKARTQREYSKIIRNLEKVKSLCLDAKCMFTYESNLIDDIINRVNSKNLSQNEIEIRFSLF